jgi:hypothetical protein
MTGKVKFIPTCFVLYICSVQSNEVALTREHGDNATYARSEMAVPRENEFKI